MGGFPAWDEYEQQTIKSLDKVTAAQNAYIEDLKAGFQLQSDLQGQVSQNVMAYLENMDPATRGALARFRETNKEEFDIWLRELDANLTEAGGLTNDFWSLKLPGAMQSGFDTMVSNLATQVQGMNLPGEQAFQAFSDGLLGLMSQMEPETAVAFEEYLRTAMTETAFLDSLGFDAGDNLVLGFLRALSRLGMLAGISIRQAAIDIGATFDDSFGIKSPSKMTMEVGKELTRGLIVGMEDQMAIELQRTHLPIVNVMGPKPVVNLQTKVQSGSRDITIMYPEHRQDDLIHGVQAASILNGLQRDAEVAIGPG
jgi:hypothetical protein